MAEVLRTHRIYLDRGNALPSELGQLITRVKELRSGPPTPRSMEIKDLWKISKNKQEKDAIAMLEPLISYMPGQDGIDRGEDHRWRVGAVPIPDVKNDKTLERALAAKGMVKTPVPDICYGYRLQLFDEDTRTVMGGLGESCFVDTCSEEPLLPFLVMEWKAIRTKGTLVEAQQQVMRDGSATVNSMVEFFAETTGHRNTTADKSAVFSLCLDSNYVELRVHWQDVDGMGRSTWEADVIMEGLLQRADEVFRIRSCVLNIMSWAKSDRLGYIKGALN